MKDKMKRFRQFLIAVIFLNLILVAPIPAYAMEDGAEGIVSISDNRIGPRNTNINVTNISLSFKDGKAHCSASLYAYDFTQKVKIEMTLYKYSGGWKTVSSWSSSGTTYAVLNQSSVVSAGKYKLTVKYTADKEVITKSVEKTK